MWDKIHFFFFFFFFLFEEKSLNSKRIELLCAKSWWINLIRYRRRRRRRRIGAVSRKSNETWKTRPTRKVMRSMFETSSLGPSTFFFAKQVPTVVILFMSLVLEECYSKIGPLYVAILKTIFSLSLFSPFHKYFIFQRRNGESKA